VTSTDNEIRRITFDVEGIHCSMCVQTIESALTKMKGVYKANVNFTRQTLTSRQKGQQLSTTLTRQVYPKLKELYVTPDTKLLNPNRV